MSGDLRARLERERDVLEHLVYTPCPCPRTTPVPEVAAVTAIIDHLARVLDADPDTPTNPALSLMGVPDDNNDDFSDLYVDDADDPDTLTTDDPECCASGRCEVCSPGFDWARNGALPDAPVDDGKDKLDANLSDRASDDSDALLVEQIALLLDVQPPCEHVDREETAVACARCQARALVVARPWQAEVEAARQDDALLIDADSQLSYIRHRRASSLTDDDKREIDAVLTRLRSRTDAIIRAQRDRAARGETRQP